MSGGADVAGEGFRGKEGKFAVLRVYQSSSQGDGSVHLVNLDR